MSEGAKGDPHQFERLHEAKMIHPLPSMPVAETNRLRLRPLGLSDAEAFQAMTDEPSILDMVHFLPRPFTLADAEKLLLGECDGRDCFWGAYLRQDSTLIGTLGTHLRGSDEIEVGYWFATAVRGRGLAAEAVSGIVLALSEAYCDRRIVAQCRPQNEASWRLLEKVGFRASGADGSRPGRKLFVFSNL
jgi:RimJ/RimL family protein N-acetyltransferase